MSEQKIKYWWSPDKKWFCIQLGGGHTTVSLTPEEACLLAGNAMPPDLVIPSHTDDSNA